MSVNGSCEDGAMDDSWVVIWHGLVQASEYR